MGVSDPGGNGQKLMHRKYHLQMRKNLITVKLTMPWNRLPREAVKILKNYLDTILYHVLWDYPA